MHGFCGALDVEPEVFFIESVTFKGSFPHTTLSVARPEVIFSPGDFVECPLRKWIEDVEESIKHSRKRYALPRDNEKCVYGDGHAIGGEDTDEGPKSVPGSLHLFAPWSVQARQGGLRCNRGIATLQVLFYATDGCCTHPVFARYCTLGTLGWPLHEAILRRRL